LDRGYRLTELLKQGLNSPLLVEEQVVSIWAGTRGHLDGVDVSDVGRFEGELLDWFRTRHIDVLADISASGKIADEDAFDASIAAFAEQFEGSVVGGSTPDAESTGTASTIVDADTTLPEEDISETE
jgi:F-type H+-transporting ATPase subunit alpha